MLQARLEPSGIEKGAPSDQLMCAGLYLVQKDRTDELPTLISRLREAGAKQGETELQVQERVREVKGYQAWRARDLKRAARLWAKSNQADELGAVLRGDLYREIGEPRQAEGWYLAAWRHPVVHERLGQLFEEMDEPEKAKAAYERFVEAWKNADPGLQDRVEKARKRLEALSEQTNAE